jgi:WD domain, G-beta repeat/F-box domain
MRKQGLLAIKPSSDTLGLLQSLHQFLQTPALREAQADTEISYAEFYKFLQQSEKQALLQSLDLEIETMVRFLQQWQLEAASKRDIQLPDEIWRHIFSFFKGNELYQTMMVSKQFCNLTKSMVPLTLDYTIPPQYQFMRDQIKGNIYQLKMLDQNRLMIVLSYDELKAIAQEIDFQLTQAEKINACICIFDIETGKCLQALNSQMKGIETIKLTPNNEIICYGNGILQTLDLTTGQCKKRFESSVADCIDMVLPNGNIITHRTHFFDGVLEVWDDTMEKLKHEFSDVCHFVVLTNGDIVYDYKRKAVMLWDSLTGESKLLFSDILFGCKLAEMPNGDIVSGFITGKVQVWDRKTGECKLTYEGHIGQVTSIVAFPNGDIASSADDEIHIWDGCGRTRDSKCILKMTIPGIRQGGQTRPVRLRLLNKNILMSRYDYCDSVIFWQFSETKKLAPLTKGAPPTYQLSIRGQSKILPDNLGRKTDCSEEELENFRLKLEAQLYMPVVEHQWRASTSNLSSYNRKETESGLFSDNKKETDSDLFSDDEEETDSDLFYEDEDPDDPAPSKRSP